MSVGSTGYTLSAGGAGIWLAILPPKAVNALPPGILVTLSGGASLTYSVEASGDEVNANTLDTAGAQTASGNWTLLGAVGWVRLNITAYTSGSATIRVVQQ